MLLQYEDERSSARDSGVAASSSSPHGSTSSGGRPSRNTSQDTDRQSIKSTGKLFLLLIHLPVHVIIAAAAAHVIVVVAGSVGKHPDPCKEVCDIPVKIADLGNACWTVSTMKASAHSPPPPCVLLCMVDVIAVTVSVSSLH